MCISLVGKKYEMIKIWLAYTVSTERYLSNLVEMIKKELKILKKVKLNSLVGEERT